MRDFRGQFLVLDGVEGCGKSTQARLLAEALAERGYEVVLTHEPGDTDLGARLRHLLLHDEVRMSALAETFLFCADRAEHVERVIVPALSEGAVVVSDRFSASTFAYQSWAGEVAKETYYRLDEVARAGLATVPGREAGATQPDLTILVDLDPAVGMTRKGLDAAPPDRFETRPAGYHQRVREGFLRYAKTLGASAVVINGDQPAEDLHQEILIAVGLTG